jgi:hypothetical protein
MRAFPQMISFFILLSCCMRREMRFEKFSFVAAAAKLRPLQFSDDAAEVLLK